MLLVLDLMSWCGRGNSYSLVAFSTGIKAICISSILTPRRLSSAAHDSGLLSQPLLSLVCHSIGDCTADQNGALWLGTNLVLLLEWCSRSGWVGVSFPHSSPYSAVLCICSWNSIGITYSCYWEELVCTFVWFVGSISCLDLPLSWSGSFEVTCRSRGSQQAGQYFIWKLLALTFLFRVALLSPALGESDF